MPQRFPLLALFLALVLSSSAKDAVAPPHTYFDPATIDARALLPAPPGDNSDATEKELEIVLQAQASRTPEQLARIKLEEHYNIYVFNNVIGPWFTPEYSSHLPLTTALLGRVMETAKPIVVAAKGDYLRPRPFLINSRVIPPIERPKDSAYPSGHSTRATLDALVLAELVPGQGKEIHDRGEEVGNDRVIAGVHYPSDVIAGRILGRAIFDRLLSQPAFRDELKAAEAEIKTEMDRRR